MAWKIIVSRLQECAAILSFLANYFLILLVLTKSPKQIGSYKYLIIYTSVLEIFYSIIDVLIEPITLSCGSIFIVLVNIDQTYFTREICLILISTWAALFGSFMGLFILQFIYRYFVSTGSTIIETFKSWRIIVWMSIPPCCGVLWGLLAYYLMYPDDQIDDAIRDVLMVRFGWNVENIAYIGPYLYRTHNKQSFIDKIHVLNMIGLILMSIIMISSITIIAICAIKCYKKINNYSNITSQKSKSLQFQLFYALVLQTSIPLILMHLPVTILFFCTIFNLNMGSSSGIVNMSIAIFPSSDPFPVMFIIKSYRNAILKMIRRFVSFCVENRVKTIIQN